MCPGRGWFWTEILSLSPLTACELCVSSTGCRHLGTLGQSVYHGLRSGESSEVGWRS